MPAVQHMKWYGWGVEGVSFHHEDKPALRPFVLEIIDLDLDTPPKPRTQLSDLDIPAPRISPELHAELVAVVGVDNTVDEDEDRIVHTYGKSIRDLMRLRANDIPRVPDVVVYPADEAEVQQVVDAAVAADAVLIPFGGGSNIAGSLQAPEDETRAVISLDLGRRLVTRADGTGVELTRTEFDLLAFLLRHKDRALPRGEILDAVWGRDVVVDPRTVDNFVSSLKKKLGWTSASGFSIHTIRGVGYRMEVSSP